MLDTFLNAGDIAANKTDKIPCLHEAYILMQEMHNKYWINKISKIYSFWDSCKCYEKCGIRKGGEEWSRSWGVGSFTEKVTFNFRPKGRVQISLLKGAEAEWKGFPSSGKGICEGPETRGRSEWKGTLWECMKGIEGKVGKVNVSHIFGPF